MASTLSKSGITDGGQLLSGHVTQSIDALTGALAYDITISGSLDINNAPVTNLISVGFISSSGTVTGNKLVGTNITSSNNIQINGGGLDIKNSGAQSYARFYCEVSNAHYTELKAQPHSLFSGNPVVLLPNYDLDFRKPKFEASITASGAISASGTISAFGSSSLHGLPTTEPSIAGTMWLSGSGAGSASGSKYLMVFTG
tara:strand:+ start:2893 stop:3492 length:600 start_codon:yes stop_codon:yes gene_type:complete